MPTQKKAYNHFMLSSRHRSPPQGNAIAQNPCCDCPADGAMPCRRFRQRRAKHNILYAVRCAEQQALRAAWQKKFLLVDLMQMNNEQCVLKLSIVNYPLSTNARLSQPPQKADKLKNAQAALTCSKNINGCPQEG